MSITDTGAGLAKDQLAQLFQAFNRLGQEAGGEEGTGIGLVVARRLVELMGGTIGVESTVGKGSTFWFELQALAEPQLLPAAGASPIAQVRAPTAQRRSIVLYVEDNPANLKLVEQIIARHPHLTLISAINADLGLALARKTLPDLILMDINLPGPLDGFDAMKLLRAGSTTGHIPVVAVSANAMPLDVERGLRAGFFRYLTKPIRVAEFIEAVNQALEFGTHG